MAFKVKGVIFDIGCRYIKAGFAGESSPRCIVPCPELEGLFYNTTSASSSVKEWTEKLGNIFSNIFINDLFCKSSLCRVIIIEPIVSPNNFREALGIVLFNQLQVSEIALYNSIISTMHIHHGHGKLTGLFIDIGWKETRVMAIYQGCPIFNTLIMENIGVLSICEEIERLYNQENENTNIISEFQSKEGKGTTQKKEKKKIEFYENIMVRTCFVRSRNDHRLDAQDVIIGQCPGHEVKVKGKLTSHACDVLFNNDNISNISISSNRINADRKNGEDDDDGGGGIAVLVLESLNKCDINIRHEIINNMIIVGGGSMLPGLKYRLSEEIHALVGIEEFPVKESKEKVKKVVSKSSSLKRTPPLPPPPASVTNLSKNLSNLDIHSDITSTSKLKPIIENELKQERIYPYYRLKGCIEKYLNMPCDQFHGNVMTWIGGSILSSLSYSLPFILNKNNYKHENFNDFLSLNKLKWIMPDNSTDNSPHQNVKKGKLTKLEEMNMTRDKGGNEKNKSNEINKNAWVLNQFGDAWIKLRNGEVSEDVVADVKQTSKKSMQGKDKNEKLTASEKKDNMSEGSNIQNTFAVAGIGIL